MKTIRGTRALVTGAASGIGRSIALALAREGAHLFLLDIDEEALAAVAGEARALGVEVVARRCDLRDPDQIDRSIGELTESWGQLHILVNNAGLLYYGNTGEMTADQCDEVMAVNLSAPIALVRSLLPMLLAQEESHIVNVCSLAGLVPIRKIAAYQATKFALVGLSLSLRGEFRRGRRLGVTALCPGLVDSSLIDNARRRNWSNKSGIPFGALAASPDRVAARAITAIRRNRGLVLVSWHARFVWMLYRLWPGFFDFYEFCRDPAPRMVSLADRVSPGFSGAYRRWRAREKTRRLQPPTDSPS